MNYKVQSNIYNLDLEEHHSGAIVIQIPQEVENLDAIEMPLTPLTPTNGFDFDSCQETIIPKVNE